jgi:predicted DNA-binding protein (MmcQ/YjbR family)
MPNRDRLDAALRSLRDFALSYPRAAEDHPWGETAIKVKGKVFIFLSRYQGKLNLSVKLPVSGASALDLPFAEPTGYGLGKHGWVTASFPPGASVPLDLIREWIDESYRAVAPKSILAELERGESLPAKKPARPRPRGRRIR